MFIESESLFFFLLYLSFSLCLCIYLYFYSLYILLLLLLLLLSYYYYYYYHTCFLVYAFPHQQTAYLHIHPNENSASGVCAVTSLLLCGAQQLLFFFLCCKQTNEFQLISIIRSVCLLSYIHLKKLLLTAIFFNCIVYICRYITVKCSNK